MGRVTEASLMGTGVGGSGSERLGANKRPLAPTPANGFCKSRLGFVDEVFVVLGHVFVYAHSVPMLR